MAEKLMKVEVNCKTGEESYIPLSIDEIAEMEARAAQAELDLLEQETEAQRIANLKASAKAKLVSGEPLTAEEAALLVL
jgi:hypothetical protein